MPSIPHIKTGGPCGLSFQQANTVNSFNIVSKQINYSKKKNDFTFFAGEEEGT